MLIGRNAVGEYTFVGDCGEKATTSAEKLLNLVARRRGETLAACFALPRFDEQRANVMWFAPRGGQARPFTELLDSDQVSFLDRLDDARRKLLSLVDDLAREAVSGNSEARVYAQLLPLLLNLPRPGEYHLFSVDGQPVLANWGMNRGAALSPADTVGPLIDEWRQRLEARDRQARELAENAARERSFLGRLTRAGARSGEITVSLLWNDVNDLDLHVVCPNGERISFENKAACGGLLDIDRNAFPESLTSEPVENIVWARTPTQPGLYIVGVHFFRQHDPSVSRSAFEVRVKLHGKVQHTTGVVGPNGFVEVTRFSV